MNTLRICCPTCGQVPELSRHNSELSCCTYRAGIIGGDIYFLTNYWNEKIAAEYILETEALPYDKPVGWKVHRLFVNYSYMGGRDGFEVTLCASVVRDSIDIALQKMNSDIPFILDLHKPRIYTEWHNYSVIAKNLTRDFPALYLSTTNGKIFRKLHDYFEIKDDTRTFPAYH